MNQHTTSLSLSQKLKRLGVKYPCHYWWVKDMFEDKYSLENWKGQYADELVKEDTYVSAFLASELMEMLPTKAGDVYHEIITTKEGAEDGKYTCAVHNVVSGRYKQKFIADTLPEALGSMLAYLLEEGIIKI